MSEIDLNLLRVFDTLIELGSVTRAADRLGLTQSAVSHALGRLRERLGDRLFVRGPDGLQPTARALEMAPGIHEGLLQLRGALAPSGFDPASAHRRFTLAAASYFCAVLVPALIERVRAEAPGVSLKIAPMAEDLVPALDQGAIDLALGSFARVPSRFLSEPLFDEVMVWVAAADHPILRGAVSPEQLARHPRIEIVTARALDGRGTLVSEGGLERRVIGEVSGGELPAEGGATVYDSLTALAVVARSDAIALVPRRVVLAQAEAGGVAIIPGVPSGEPIGLALLWHRKQREDVGLKWLRAVVRSAVGEAAAAQPTPSASSA